MQRLTDAEINANPQSHVEAIPALEGTKHYFAMVHHNNRQILCILDGGRWRPTNYNEMMSLVS